MLTDLQRPLLKGAYALARFLFNQANKFEVWTYNWVELFEGADDTDLIGA